MKTKMIIVIITIITIIIIIIIIHHPRSNMGKLNTTPSDPELPKTTTKNIQFFASLGELISILFVNFPFQSIALDFSIPSN